MKHLDRAAQLTLTTTLAVAQLFVYLLHNNCVQKQLCQPDSGLWSVSVEEMYIWLFYTKQVPLLSIACDVALTSECGPDSSLWSMSDEELSQRLCESLFVGAELLHGGEGDPEAPQEEMLLLGASGRLRTAVDKLLDLLDHQPSKQVGGGRTITTVLY